VHAVPHAIETDRSTIAIADLAKITIFSLCLQTGPQLLIGYVELYRPTPLPSEPLMTAVRYCKNRRDAFFRFIDDPDVPIDNSPTGREFQNTAKLRLNMLSAGSPRALIEGLSVFGSDFGCNLRWLLHRRFTMPSLRNGE
jgi:hypothetical protein